MWLHAVGLVCMGVLGELRRIAGMSVAELASLAGVSRQHVWRIENEGSGMTVGTAQRLAAALASRLGVPESIVLQALIAGRADGMLKQEVSSRYLDIREASRYLGVPQSALRVAIRSGRLHPRAVPGLRGKVLISLEELDRYAREWLEVERDESALEVR
jgi:excisionase family DNA binding protein